MSSCEDKAALSNFKQKNFSFVYKNFFVILCSETFILSQIQERSEKRFVWADCNHQISRIYCESLLFFIGLPN